jgi:translocation and assembly module TamB
MTNLPPPNNTSDTDRDDRLWLRRLKQIGIPLGVVTLAGGAAATWWGWQFVNNDLSPLIEKNLTKSLNRPVKLGRVEHFGLTTLQIGPSSLPPTSTDPDQLSIQSVRVNFNPLRLLFSRDLNLNITAVKPEIYLEQSKDGAWVTTQLAEQEETGPIKTEIQTVRIEDAKAVLVPWSKKGGKGQPVILNGLQGKVNFFDQNKRFEYQVSGKSASGGNLNLTGETRREQKTQTTQLQVKGENFLVSEIDRLVNIPDLELQAGRVTGTVGVKLQPNQKIPDLSGDARFTGVTLKAQGVPQPLTQGKGNLALRGTEIRLTNTTGNYGTVPALVNGTVDTQKGFNLGIQVKSATVPDVVKSLKLPLPVPVAGAITADMKLTGPLQGPILEGSARNTKAGKVDRIALDQYSGRFRLDAGKRLLTLTDIKATPTAGGVVTGGGRVNLTEPTTVALVFDASNVAADAIARSYNNGNPLAVTIGQVNAQTQITGPANNLNILTRWQAPAGTYPASGDILIANGVTTLRNTVLSVAGGVARVEGQAANGRWQGNVTGSGIQLSRLSPELRGLFNGSFVASGSLSSFSPSSIRAQGQASFSKGIAVINEPLTAQVRWDGQKLVIDRATAPGLNVDGAVYAQLQGTPGISALDLNVRANNYNLQAFAIPVPGRVSYSGGVDFVGSVRGTPTAPVVAGDVALRQFVLNGIAFEPLLTGSLRVDRGVNFNVAGGQDRIAAVLNSAYRPIAFDIRRGDAIATGRTQGDLLNVTAENFPVALLNSFVPSTQFPLGGKLNGTFAVNLNNYNVTGQLAIADPSIGTYRASQFGGRISFANGVATLTQGELRRGNTVFRFSGSATVQGNDPKFKGQLTVAQGNLQDLLKLLNVFELSDVTQGFGKPVPGNKTDLGTVPVDMTGVPILDQLRRLAEIQALQAQAQAQRDASPLPGLDELQGTFGGSVDVSGSLRSGINASFNVQGENWVWGPYSAKKMVAIGTFANGELTLLPLRFQSDQSVVAFSGQISSKQQSGQFRMENVPLSSLNRLIPASVPIDGNLNATATLAGTVENPQAIGEISLTDGSLNGKPIREARGSFQYTNARLAFGSRVVAAEPEPIVITGSLPFRLPFATVFPDSDAISLNVNVKNDGLAVLNLLNNQVEWVNGKGVVSLQVGGTLTKPVATGLIQVEDATLKARALPDPLTNVNGRITLNGGVMNVEQVTGRFSNGQIVARGLLPLTAAFATSDPNAANPLTVRLEKIALNLKGLYRGAVNGNVIVGGTVFSPQLGGQVTLSDGNVLLAGSAQETGGSRGGADSGNQSPVEFNNLRLTLGDRLRITSYPILNFLAAGNLLINGSLDAPRPRGVINLRSGQVNLFTTQFNLERGYPQTAEFTENQGLDPILNVRLVAIVAEVTGSRLPTTINSSEIVDTPNFNRFGSVESVRVQARVTGPASELNENLQLTSSPPRSQAEIVALIGGGFISNLEQGQVGLGLANLAGSALLTNVQNVVANTLGLSYFRLFPTITPNQTSRASRSQSNLDLAMEVGVDITRSLSVIVLKVLTSDQPAQFGLRYRLNDNVLFRGSTDFSGDNRAVVEYERRF